MSEPVVNLTSREQLLAGLGKPFPKEAIKKRPGGGNKQLEYVQTHAVIHRLNDVAPGWDFHINQVVFQEFPDKNRDGQPITGRVLIVTGTLTIPGLGSRDGIGIQRWDPAKSEDLVKGAASDALKKSATLFGVALELYGEDYEGEAAAPTAAAQPSPPSPTQNKPEAVPSTVEELFTWARKQGWTSKSQMEQAIGRPLKGMSVAEMYETLRTCSPEPETAAGDDWLAKVNAAPDRPELSRIANALLKAGIKRASGHPAWARLDERMKEAGNAAS